MIYFGVRDNLKWNSTVLDEFRAECIYCKAIGVHFEYFMNETLTLDHCDNLSNCRHVLIFFG